MIFNEDQLSNKKIKQYQETDHKEIMKYPEREREQTMSSTFRNSRHQGMFIPKETVHEHFKVNSKSIGRGHFVQKLKNDHYKEHDRIIFVILDFILLIGFLVFFFVIL